MTTNRFAVAAALGLGLLPSIASSQSRALEHDPFVKPQRIAAQRHSVDAAKAPASEVREPSWKAELRAVMIAGSASMVNVDGAVLRMGEEIKGYRLIEVHDNVAVFIKDGRRVPLAMREGMHAANPPPEKP